MEFPSDLLYSKDHEWIRIEGDIATVGVTAFASSELGDIVFVELDSEGEDLDAEEVFGTVEAVKTVSDLFMPMAGTVTEVNGALEDNPEAVNNEPYGAGWMVKIKLTDPAATDHLMSADAYQEMVG